MDEELADAAAYALGRRCMHSQMTDAVSSSACFAR